MAMKHPDSDVLMGYFDQLGMVADAFRYFREEVCDEPQVAATLTLALLVKHLGWEVCQHGGGHGSGG